MPPLCLRERVFLLFAIVSKIDRVFILLLNRMEPSWTKDIQKRPICDFFYFLFVLRVTLAVIVLFTLVLTFMYMKKLPPGVSLVMIPFQIGVMGIAVIEALFLYLLCERSLPQVE